MGIVARQSLKNNLITYLAVLVGVVANIFIYSPQYSLKGHADGLLKWAMLLYPFFTLGMSLVMVRFLPYLRGDRDEAAGQLLTRALLVTTLGLLGLAAVNFFFGQLAIDYLLARNWQVGKLENYRWIIFGLLAAMVYASVLTANFANYKRIDIPALFNNLLPKIGLPCLVLLVMWEYWDRQDFTLGLVLLYGVAALGMLLYALKLRIFRLRWGRLSLADKSLRDVVSLGVFGIFGSVGSVLTVQIDTIYVNTVLGDGWTGIYSFAVFVAMVIAIPYKSINAIAAPLVAEAWKERALDKLQDLYQDSAEVLFGTGALIYTAIVVGSPYLFQLTPDMGNMSPSYWPLVLLGAGQLFDQLTSVNTTLINYTDYYRWSVVFLLIAGGVNLVLNHLFITVYGYGITGAALGTMITLFLYNLLKGGFLYYRVGLQPLRWRMLPTFFLFLLLGTVCYLLPALPHPLLSLGLQGVVLAAGFLTYVWFFNGVPLLKRALQDGWKKSFKI